ncbi:adenylate/guanylate cyclase domain-containing protein [Rufibacter tibetensis]|uniref:Guanylate cyclase domain-containing protein n=1 Tax=Rufibacter tibetensis TaxID=512763 RepID=A0A0P0CYP2_9BACT|nr:adenylate/guanylate cyclase domain-containing protein [Rufibacter tibetensis]ALI99657.1 hypothetical protein DC20_12585 [Rufibacter tibetensis]
MIKYLIIPIFILMGNLRLLAQVGNPFIQTFEPAAYRSDAYISSPQNWGLIQDNRGIIYVSNTSGILEYDGATWQAVQGTNYQGNFQLAKNSEGRVFVGGNQDIGYLAPDSTGKMQLVSLLPHLKGKYKDLSVTKVASIGRDVYFSTKNTIFRWSNGGFKAWHSSTGFARVFSCRNQLYAIDKEKGLCVLEKDQLKALPDTKKVGGLTVTALLPLLPTTGSKHNLLLVTFDKGLYTYQDHVLQKLELSPAPEFGEAQFMHGIMLADGTIALATTTKGVIIINHQGRVKKVIDKQAGLNDNTVLHLFKDREGGLWAGLNIGISRIDYPSPVAFLNGSSRLEGLVLSVLKKRQNLYAGTTSGLYVADVTSIEPSFQKFPQLQNEVWKILDLGDMLLVLSSTGLYQLSNKVLKKISPVNGGGIYKTIHQSQKDLNKFYVGSSEGLYIVLNQDGRWKWEGKVKGVNHDVTWLTEDQKNKVWATCENNISVIDAASEYGLQPPVQNLKPSPETVKKLTRFEVHSINGNIYFGTNKGIYSFQKRGKRLQLEPDKTFGSMFANGSREAINLTPTSNGEIWLTSEFRTGPLRKVKGNAYVWDTIPLSMMPNQDVWTIHPDPQGVVWMGTTDGIFNYNSSIAKNYLTKPHTVLRKVKLLGDSTVFFGAFENKGIASVIQSLEFRLTLPHAIRSIRFEFAATSYDAPAKLQYSYMLEGEDNNWSHWTPERRKEYTGLDEGSYVFKVKARNMYGTESVVSSFAFTSLPPFYRTWWAYCLYFILWVGFIWGFVQIKHRNLVASKNYLEELVHQRTMQLEAEKQKSDELLLNILPAETAEELKARGRTQARSYENATVLFTDFKDFTRISQDLTPEELVTVIDFYFCAFDGIISKYNIEKIKTMGDAYMCAGGIPNPEANTPADVIKAAMEIVAFVERLNPPDKPKKHKFEIRVGIHTGPVVAGIVGTKKFAYDIWGDTVNTAARMESSGVEGKINISGATYELVKDEFICSHRGKVEAKNKGEIDMYFVEAVVEKQVLEHSHVQSF